MRRPVDNPLKEDLVQALFMAQGLVICVLVLIALGMVIKTLLF